MTVFEGLSQTFHPDWNAFVDNVSRKGTPKRVHNIELWHDAEIIEAITQRFDLMKGVDRADPNYHRKQLIALNRFCGLEYVKVQLNVRIKFDRIPVEDTATLKRESGRVYQDEHSGPILNWEDFKKYQWPDPNLPEATADLEWYHENVPDDMCLIGGHTAHICENLTWMMGYEPFCYALLEQPDLIRAIADKLMVYYRDAVQRFLEFDRVRMIWATDDMGFKSSLLFSPDHMREYVFPIHKKLAEMTHAVGRHYILHSCGNLSTVMNDLVDDVRIDAKHSFEDTIENICDAKQTYGRQVALLGGMDVDFLCRSYEGAIRRRVRETIDVCQPGGGFCIGSGNTVANYIPVDNYLAMIDEARLYGA